MANHIQVPGELKIDLKAPFSQQGIFTAIRTAYPTDPNLSVVGIAVPLVHINCLEWDGEHNIIVNAWEEIKKAAMAIYNYMMQYYVQWLWNLLYGLFKVFENLISGIIDLTLPIFNLHISDLFDPNLRERLTEWIKNLYYNAKDQLYKILDTLGIKWPPFDTIKSAWHEIEYLVEAILHSLWGFVLKAIKKLISLIELGLKAWEAINTNGVPTWSQIWTTAKDTILGYIMDLLTNVPTIDQIEEAVTLWAKLWWKKLTVTAAEIMEAIKHFSFGIFGKPFDWDLPWNPHISAPEIDFRKMLTSILLYCKNFLFNIINTFVEAVMSVLKFFGIDFGTLGVITIPITLCAVRNEG